MLKGALLLRATGISDIRPTRDIDLLKYGDSGIPELEKNISECCTITIGGDGLEFDPDSVQGEQIKGPESLRGRTNKRPRELG